MCERCEELEEEVAYLKSELGTQVDAERVANVARGLRLAPGETALLLMLYAAKARPMSIFQAVEALPVTPRSNDRDPKIIAVYVSKIRKKLGRGVIENVWGRGYRLSATGMDLIARAVGDATPIPEPVDFESRASEELRSMAALIAGLLAHKDGDGGTQTAITYRRIADRLTGQPRVAA